MDRLVPAHEICRVELKFDLVVTVRDLRGRRVVQAMQPVLGYKLVVFDLRVHPTKQPRVVVTGEVKEHMFDVLFPNS